jgi:hypothetical protein
VCEYAQKLQLPLTASSSVLFVVYIPYVASVVKCAASFDLIQFLAKDVELQDPFKDGCIYRDMMFFHGNAEVFAWILQASNLTHQ